MKETIGRFRCVVFLLAAFSALNVDLVFAGSGGTIQLPAMMRKKVKNGIIAEIDTRWTDGWGYRPVKIKLSVRKTKRDRTIRVDLVPHSERQPFGTVEPLMVSTEVKIPQGEKSVTKTVYVPQQTPWERTRVDFYENNRKLKDLSVPYGIHLDNHFNQGAPCALMVDRDAPSTDGDRQALIKKLRKTDSKNLPDAEKLAFLNNTYYLRQRNVDTSEFEEKGRAPDDNSLTMIAQLGNLEMLPHTDLPKVPIGLTGIDLVIIPLEELKELAETDEERFHAIDFYVRNGGNLVTFSKEGLDNLCNEAQQLFKRDLLFEVSVAYPQRVYDSVDDLVVAGDTDDSGISVSRPQKNKGKKTSRIPKNLPLFSVADHGYGRIAVIDAADPYEEAVVYWQWLLQNIGADRLTFPDRHGISLVNNNNDYWDFMIPGFGASPVEGFLGVITLFIVVIGPLNFYLLKKFKRMYYLPLTVVAAALLTTITMMCYAVVSDGVATRVRLRSFTLLDQHDEEHVAMTQCRQSYLAALAPSEGLVYPQQTCVYPILPFVDGSEERSLILRERTGKKALKRGYIRSRTTMQFLTTNVEETALGIENAADGRKNSLGVNLDHIWICDEEKDFYQAKDVPADAMIDFQPVVLKDTMMELNKIIDDNRPAPPLGLDKTSNDSIFGSNWNRWRYRQSRPVYTKTAILHQNIAGIPDFFRKPRPNTFLVITKEAPEFVHQGTRAREEASFHVIRGNLKASP